MTYTIVKILPGLQRLDCIATTRVPQNPAVKSVVITGFYLSTDLFSAIGRRSEREVLIPRNHFRSTTDTSTSPLHILERAIDRCVWMSVGIAKSIRAWREVAVSYTHLTLP